ncbi:MAG: gluconate 2-dehydrogenase subunit 3 family protein, partial [Acidobacteria bacterium]|nr:gluconate 2-dehydrogenase subunit 3 family protein [Acidobacteriota bacterium]
ARSNQPRRFLYAEEARTVQAICEQIIPEDENCGAARAGVVNFIDRQLAGFYREHQETYRRGIAGVDESSLTLFHARFADLSSERQTAVLVAMEKNRAPGESWKQLPAKTFFDLIVSHTMQGFYGSPRHGGNRDAVSWRMLGVPVPPVRGRLIYDGTKQAARRRAWQSNT